MECTPKSLMVAELLDLREKGWLEACPQYQRGPVWKAEHKAMLVDSLMRGYPVPQLYIRCTRDEVAGYERDRLEIVDGRQRIAAIEDFARDAFELFDPASDRHGSRFPAFIEKQPCPWGGLRYSELTSDLRERFRTTRIQAIEFRAERTDEVHDLFIRLQSGMPLNSQEKRDAWPGDCSDLVLELGGKTDLAVGHPFFKLVGLGPESGRARVRRVAAQLVALVLTQVSGGREAFVGLGSQELDRLYHRHIEFDAETVAAAAMIRGLLDQLEKTVANGRRELPVHVALHLVLLARELRDRDKAFPLERLGPAVDRFLQEFESAKGQTSDPFWSEYGQWTRVNSDAADRVAQRHRFFRDCMLEYIGKPQAAIHVVRARDAPQVRGQRRGRPPKDIPSTSQGQVPPLGNVLTMAQPRAGLIARGYPTRSGFMVLAGSEANRFDAASLEEPRQRLRRQLQRTGVLKDTGRSLVFEENYEFGSASEAASILAGSQRNGRMTWRTEDGRPLSEASSAGEGRRD